MLRIARDLTASLAASDRYTRLLDAVRRVIPCDAACLLRLDGPYLTPVAGFGLSTAALSRRYDRREQPRLDVILRSKDPGAVSARLASLPTRSTATSSARCTRTTACTPASAAR